MSVAKLRRGTSATGPSGWIVSFWRRHLRLFYFQRTNSRLGRRWCPLLRFKPSVPRRLPRRRSRETSLRAFSEVMGCSSARVLEYGGEDSRHARLQVVDTGLVNYLNSASISEPLSFTFFEETSSWQNEVVDTPRGLFGFTRCFALWPLGQRRSPAQLQCRFL